MIYQITWIKSYLNMYIIVLFDVKKTNISFRLLNWNRVALLCRSDVLSTLVRDIFKVLTRWQARLNSVIFFALIKPSNVVAFLLFKMPECFKRLTKIYCNSIWRPAVMFINPNYQPSEYWSFVHAPFTQTYMQVWLNEDRCPLQHHTKKISAKIYYKLQITDWKQVE